MAADKTMIKKRAFTLHAKTSDKQFYFKNFIRSLTSVLEFSFLLLMFHWNIFSKIKIPDDLQSLHSYLSVTNCGFYDITKLPVGKKIAKQLKRSFAFIQY